MMMGNLMARLAALIVLSSPLVFAKVNKSEVYDLVCMKIFVPHLHASESLGE